MKTMKIILSPAKKMRVETDCMPVKALPRFLDKAEKLMHFMKSLSLEDARQIWKCSEKLAILNYERFARMDLQRGLTPALLSYEGIQYQYMAPNVFSERQWEYVEEHLRILSGFYGILSPLDGVVPYRLEMQAKGNFFLDGEACKDLYEVWKEEPAEALLSEASWVLNLASREYAKAVEPYLKRKIPYITCIFGEEHNGKIIQKGTKAKMARGEMVRWLSKMGGKEPEELKGFSSLGYRFCEKGSTEDTYLYLEEK